MNGPYNIPASTACGGSARTHKPRLAVGGGRVFAAFEGWYYNGTVPVPEEHQTCEVCYWQFNPSTGATVAGTGGAYWNDQMTHTDYDVEWNGIDRFIYALPYDIDAGMNSLSTYGHFTSGVTTAETVLQNFDLTPSPAFPSRVQLVFSKNANNSNRMFLQTNTASYWLDTNGARIGSILTNSAGTKFAACEYWGADAAAAHVFLPGYTSRYVGTYPTGHFVLDPRTQRSHYGLTSGPAYEDLFINSGYHPTACDGGNTASDTEVLLVSNPGGASTNVYWNILSNDT